jgi:hypothetical protein
MSGDTDPRFIKKFSGLRIIAPLFLLMFVFYLCSLLRMHSLLAGREHMFFSDVREITDTMRQVTFRGDMVKHLLFSATTSPLVRLIKILTPLEEDQAILVVIALLASANVVAAYATLKLFLQEERLALLFSVFFGFSFTLLVHFSFPETYVLTVLVIIMYFYFLIKFRHRPALKSTAVLFLITALAPLYNPPLLLLLISTSYVYYQHFSRKKFLAVSLANGLFVAGVVSVPYIIIPALVLPHTKWAALYDIRYPIEYMKFWGSFSHFLSLKIVANTAGNFLFFSLISPFRELKPPSNFLVNFKSYFGTVISTLSLAAYAGWLGLTGLRLFKRRDRVIDSSLLLILMLMIFYIYFFPRGALLYSTQVVFPLVLVFSWAINGLALKRKYVFSVVFLAMVVINNLICLFGPVVMAK